MYDQISEIRSLEDGAQLPLKTLRKAIQKIFAAITTIQLRPLVDESPFSQRRDDDYYTLKIHDGRLAIMHYYSYRSYGNVAETEKKSLEVQIGSVPDAALAELYFVLKKLIDSYLSEMRRLKNETDEALKDARQVAGLVELVEGE